MSAIDCNFAVMLKNDPLPTPSDFSDEKAVQEGVRRGMTREAAEALVYGPGDEADDPNFDAILKFDSSDLTVGKLNPQQTIVLKKKKKVAKAEFGCVMIPIDDDSEIGKLLASTRAAIPVDELMGDGADVPSHVTVRYGIIDGYDEIGDYLRQCGRFDMSFGKTIAFPPGPNSDGAAPVVVQVISPVLVRMNRELGDVGKFCPPTFDYKPHATIAYVKPEFASKYDDRQSVMYGLHYYPIVADVSSPDGEADTYPLTGPEAQKFDEALSYEVQSIARKSNPYHDEEGRFTSEAEVNKEQLTHDVYIHKAYFPATGLNVPGKEDYEQWKVKAGSRREAAAKVWAEHGERLLGAMKPQATSLPRKVSLYVGDPKRGTPPGRLEPILVHPMSKKFDTEAQKFDWVLKENPYHDETGMFTSAANASRKEQQDSVLSYQRGLRGMNASLRQGLNDKWNESTVKALDTAIEQHPLKKDTVLYRGAAVPEDVKVGDVLRDSGFKSCSKTRYVAENFDRVDNGDSKRLLAIHAKVGDAALDVTKFLGSRNHEGENEFILGRNVGFKVLSLDEPDGNGYRLIHVGIVDGR